MLFAVNVALYSKLTEFHTDILPPTSLLYGRKSTKRGSLKSVQPFLSYNSPNFVLYIKISLWYSMRLVTIIMCHNRIITTK